MKILQEILARPAHLKTLQYCIAGLILLAGLLISDGTMRYQDETDYTTIARNLVTHQSYSFDGATPTAMRPPGYVFFLAVFLYFGAGIAFLKFLNFIALAAAFLIINRALDREAGPEGSAIRLIFLFCYPVLFYTAGTLYPQIIAGTLFILLLYRSFYLPSTLLSDCVNGLLWAALILTVPTFAAMFVLLYAYLYWRKRVTLRSAALYILIVGFCITPWLVRNHSALGSATFSTNIGLNFLYGNSEMTAPNSGIKVDIQKYQLQVKNKNEAEIDRHLFNSGLRYILDNPLHSLTMYIAKTINYFNYKNEMATARESSALRDNVMLVTYYLMIIILLIRVLSYEKYPFTDIEKLLILLYFANAFISALFFTRIRLRVPYDFLLIFFAVQFLERVITARIEERKKEEEAIDDLY